MKLESPEPDRAGRGLLGTLQMAAMFVIFCLAGAGILVVFGMVPGAEFVDFAGKLGLAAGIVGLAALASAAVMRLGGR